MTPPDWGTMSIETASQIEHFFARFPLRAYPKGQILIHANDDPHAVYYIVKGKIRQYDISYRGNEIIVNVFSVGDYLPLSWALGRVSNNFFYDAEEELSVRVAPLEDVVAFIQSHHDITVDLLRKAYADMDCHFTKLVHLMAGSARNRILYEIIAECRSFGNKLGENTYFITINERDLAFRSGLSRETVSREMGKIKRDVNVVINRSGMHVENLSKLEEKLTKTM